MPYRFAASLAVLALAGCASAPSPALQAARQKVVDTVPTCDDESECRLKWELAQVWIAKNAGFALRTTTDVLLETFSPVSMSDTRLGVRVLREPLGSGRYRFLVTVVCANPFGCGMSPTGAAQNFNDTLNAATE